MYYIQENCMLTCGPDVLDFHSDSTDFEDSQTARDVTSLSGNHGLKEKQRTSHRTKQTTSPKTLSGMARRRSKEMWKTKTVYSNGKLEVRKSYFNKRSRLLNSGDQIDTIRSKRSLKRHMVPCPTIFSRSSNNFKLMSAIQKNLTRAQKENECQMFHVSNIPRVKKLSGRGYYLPQEPVQPVYTVDRQLNLSPNEHAKVHRGALSNGKTGNECSNGNSNLTSSSEPEHVELKKKKEKHNWKKRLESDIRSYLKYKERKKSQRSPHSNCNSLKHQPTVPYQVYTNTCECGSYETANSPNCSSDVGSTLSPKSSTCADLMDYLLNKMNNKYPNQRADVFRTCHCNPNPCTPKPMSPKSCSVKRSTSSPCVSPCSINKCVNPIPKASPGPCGPTRCAYKHYPNFCSPSPCSNDTYASIDIKTDPCLSPQVTTITWSADKSSPTKAANPTQCTPTKSKKSSSCSPTASTKTCQNKVVTGCSSNSTSSCPRKCSQTLHPKCFKQPEPKLQPCQVPHDCLVKSVCNKYKGEILCIHNPPCVLINGCLNIPCSKNEPMAPSKCPVMECNRASFQHLFRKIRPKKLVEQSCQYEDLKDNQIYKTNLTLGAQETIGEMPSTEVQRFEMADPDSNHTSEGYPDIMSAHQNMDQIKENTLQCSCIHQPPPENVNFYHDPKRRASSIINNNMPRCDHCLTAYSAATESSISEDNADENESDQEETPQPKHAVPQHCSRHQYNVSILTKHEAGTQVRPKTKLQCRHVPPCILVPRCLGRLCADAFQSYDAIPSCMHNPTCDMIPACCSKAKKWCFYIPNAHHRTASKTKLKGEGEGNHYSYCNGQSNER